MSTVPPAPPIGSAVSNVAQWVIPVAGETAQPLPGSLTTAVDRLGDLEVLLAEIGQRLLQLDRLGLLGVGLGAADSSSSLSTKLPSVARPGPLFGRRLSGSTSSRRPVIPVSSVSATIVTTPFLLRPVTMIEPSGSLVKIERLVALVVLGSSTTQRLTIAAAFSFSQSAIFLASVVAS